MTNVFLTENHFYNTVFSDEKWWRVGEGSNHKYWCFAGEKAPSHPRTQHPDQLRILGAMSRKGVAPLHEFPTQQKITSQIYCSAVQDSLLPWIKEKHMRHGIWQQDGAGVHRGALVNKFVKDSFPAGTLTHPPYSPDLAPIERLWAIQQRRVGQDRAKNREELREIVLEEWDRVSRETTGKLVDSLERRIVKVMEVNGGWPEDKDAVELCGHVYETPVYQF